MAMGKDYFRYDMKVQEALRGVVRAVLTEIAEDGLPGEHHFFISFSTRAPGVRISDRFREQYTGDMTIVLQHQFWDLKINDDDFEVELSFDNIPEKLVIPFAAITGFMDPSTQFGLQFDVAGANTSTAKETNAGISVIAPAAGNQPDKKPSAGKAGGKPSDTDDGPSAPAAGEPVAGEPVAGEPVAGEPVAGEIVQLDAFRKKN